MQTYFSPFFAYLSRVIYVLGVAVRTTRDTIVLAVSIVNFIILTRSSPLTTALLQDLGEPSHL